MGARKTELKPSDLKGLRDLAPLRRLLYRLHDVGTSRDKSGNRDLHMDEYCLLLLAWLFNPIVDSLRGVGQMSALKNVQKRLGVGRASMGSLSESVRVFDPEPLKQIVQELNDQLPDRTPQNYQVINKTITAVDGSVIRVLTQIAKLAWLPTANGKHSCGYRLHTQFEVFRGTPNRIDVTGSCPKGEADERIVMQRTLEPERCYLMDRGYEKYMLWNAIHNVGSNYVARTRDNPVYTVLEQRPLTDADRQQRVVSDEIVRFGGEDCRNPLQHTTRLVIVKMRPHRTGRKSSSGANSDGYLRIATNLLDVPAEIIASLYSLRWTIEIYFRMIKQLLGCRHLLSTKSEGVEIQVYLAIIACILILVHTGRTPNKRTYEMICFYLAGWAELDELEAHIQKLKTAE